MDLYSQLLKLQVIENAYTEWATYRNKLTDYLIKEAKGHDSIAIFGAGRCNDIDLKRLATHFNEVTLIDKDVEAMKSGINNQKVAHLEQIKIREVDFVGISSEAYRTYANTLINEIKKRGVKTSCTELAKLAIKEIEKLTENANEITLDFGVACYETTVVVGVHSQLLSMVEWIWSIMLQTIQQDEPSVRSRIIEMNEKYVKRFNEAVIKATKDTMIIGCEQGRVGRVGTIQGATQAIQHINEQVINGEMYRLDYTELEWPFNRIQGISYLMGIQSIQV